MIVKTFLISSIMGALLNTHTEKFENTSQKVRINKIKMDTAVLLTGVKIHAVTGSDGVDGNSRVQYAVVTPTTVAYYQLSSTEVKPGDVIDRALELRDNTITKSALNNYDFYMDINAVGHDSYNADLTVEFSFSDGTRIAWDYGHFQIGTYHESHTTRKRIHL